LTFGSVNKSFKEGNEKKRNKIIIIIKKNRFVKPRNKPKNNGNRRASISNSNDDILLLLLLLLHTEYPISSSSQRFLWKKISSKISACFSAPGAHSRHYRLGRIYTRNNNNNNKNNNNNNNIVVTQLPGQQRQYR